jgi:hypothetical protein
MLKDEQHAITFDDFDNILTMAKTSYNNYSVPMYLTNKRVDNHYVGNIILVEAVIAYLNRAGLLNKPVKMDITKK